MPRPHPVRNTLLTLFSLLPLLAYGAEPAPAKKTEPAAPSIQDCINTYDASRATKTPTGHQFWFCGRDLAGGQTIKMSVVGPRLAIHAPHRHAEDEFYYILEGKAEIFLNGETRVIGPDSTFYCPSNSLHGIKNATDGQLRYLVIKRYNPDNPNAAPTKS